MAKAIARKASLPSRLVDKDGAALLSSCGLDAAALEEALVEEPRSQNITSLTLDRNNLECLPVKGLAELGSHSLKSLWLDGNRLHSLPAALGELQVLERLHVAGNCLEQLPQELGNLQSLRALNLSKNQLRRIPVQLGRCSALETIWFSYNKLQELPETLGDLLALRSLWLNDNLLAALPKCTGRWCALEELQLGGNTALKELPESLASCKALRKLGVRGCKDLCVPPAEVMAKGVPEVLAYLERLAEQGWARCWHARWVFVGFERVGKTSLVRALQGLPFDRNERSTDGLGISSLNFDAKALVHWLSGAESSDERQVGCSPKCIPGDSEIELPQQGEILSVGLWDLAGQSLYYLTHDIFLSSRATYILVWRCDRSPPVGGADGTNDGAKSWRARTRSERTCTDVVQLERWLACLHYRAPGTTVLVVGTHAATDNAGEESLSEMDRLALSDVNEAGAAKLREKYPRLHLVFMLLDSATGFGIQAARSVLAKSTLNGSNHALPITVPRAWLSLHHRCQDMIQRMSSGCPAEAELPLLEWKLFETVCGGDCPRLREAVHFWHVLGEVVHIHETLNDDDITLQPEEDSGDQNHDTDKEPHVAAERVPMLQDFVVLKPQWLADVLRCVVTQTGATDEIRSNGGKAKVAWMRERFANAGLLRDSDFQFALMVLQRLELALPWDDARRVADHNLGRTLGSMMMDSSLASGLGHFNFLFPAMLPNDTTTILMTKRSNTPIREVLIRFPPGFHPTGLLSRLILRALRHGHMGAMNGTGAPALLEAQAVLRSKDGCVQLELRQEEQFSIKKIQLVAQSTNQEEGVRRRDDVLRRALAEVALLIGACFPGLLPESDGSLAARASILFQISCGRCVGAEATGKHEDFPLAEIEESYMGLLDTLPSCPCCGLAADCKKLLGQPVPFDATCFRPLLRATPISRGLAALVDVRNQFGAW